MRVLRLGIVAVVLVAGFGVAGAQEPPPAEECPVGTDMALPNPYDIGTGGECVCANPSGEVIGQINHNGVFVYDPIDDGDCSTPYPPVPVEEESPAVEVVAVASASPAAAPPASAGSVLRRTG